jgi:uncharacterized membrane protein
MPITVYLIGALLAFVGGALSFYFYGVYKGIINEKQWWIPSILHVSSETCTRVIDTQYGKHFGLSNVLVGIPFMIGYGIILWETGQGNISTTIPLFMGIISIVVGIYLIYGLMKLHMLCKICYTVHSINLIIFLLQFSV